MDVNFDNFDIIKTMVWNVPVINDIRRIIILYIANNLVEKTNLIDKNNDTINYQMTDFKNLNDLITYNFDNFISKDYDFWKMVWSNHVSKKIKCDNLDELKKQLHNIYNMYHTFNTDFIYNNKYELLCKYIRYTDHFYFEKLH